MLTNLPCLLSSGKANVPDAGQLHGFCQVPWGCANAQLPSFKTGSLRLQAKHACCSLQETRCFDALAELYSDLSEDDILYGLWKRRCIHEATRAGLSLVQHGYLEQAQDVFLDSMKIDTKAPAPNGTDRPSGYLWAFVLWAFVLWTFVPLSLCPLGFCPLLVCGFLL